jgi:hypothetical protein
MRLPLRHPLTALLLTFLLAGCHSWRAESVSPSRLIEAKHPGTIRITRPDGTQLLLQQPIARNDSLVGVAEGRGQTGLHLNEVRNVETRRLNAVKTGGLVLGVAGGAVVLWGVIVAIALTGCDDPCFGN